MRTKVTEILRLFSVPVETKETRNSQNEKLRLFRSGCTETTVIFVYKLQCKTAMY